MKSIALIAVSSVGIPEHCQALMYSRKEVLRSRPVERMILISDVKPPSFYTGEWIPLPQPLDILSYGRFQVHTLGRWWNQIGTDFMLNIQADGFVTNGGMWDESFLDYDYIGAPWAAPQVDGRDAAVGFRVGNSGFSLRSRRFMELSAAENNNEIHNGMKIYEDQGDDIYWCQMNRFWMDQQGIRFAPLEIAAKFSLEHTIPEYPSRTVSDCFGQHGRMKLYVQEDMK